MLFGMPSRSAWRDRGASTNSGCPSGVVFSRPMAARHRAGSIGDGVGYGLLLSWQQSCRLLKNIEFA